MTKRAWHLLGTAVVLGLAALLAWSFYPTSPPAHAQDIVNFDVTTSGVNESDPSDNTAARSVDLVADTDGADPGCPPPDTDGDG